MREQLIPMTKNKKKNRNLSSMYNENNNSKVMSRIVRIFLIILLSLQIFGCMKAEQPEGLMAYWSFDEGRSDIIDCLPSRYNGNSINPKWEKGIKGEAFNFTGDNSIKIDNCDVNLDRMFTIMFWIKTSESADDQILLSKGNENDEGHFCLYVQNKGFLKFKANGIDTIGCGVVDDNQWHHVAITYNGEDMKVYLDSLDQGGPIYTFIDIPGITQVSGSIPLSTATLCIGNNNEKEKLPFKGLLDELKMYNRELSKQEILSDLNSCPHPKVLPPVADNPVITDPVWKSCKDGCLTYNPIEKNWWYFFMQIRNGGENGVVDHYGTTVGASKSEDGGLTWNYQGTLKGLYINPGMNTVWAPDIFWDDSTKMFHAYVAYIKGVHRGWGNHKSINHYTSSDIVNWEYHEEYNFSDMNIDCTVAKLPDGKWGMWYKDETNGDITGFAIGNTFHDFQFSGFIDKNDVGRVALEGAEIFHWNGYYWLLGDDRFTKPDYHYNGIRVYRSKDCYNWDLMPSIVTENENGYLMGHHPEVVIVNDSVAYISYFVVPEWRSDNCFAYTETTMLKFDGNTLQVDRNDKFQGRFPDYIAD